MVVGGVERGPCLTVDLLGPGRVTEQVPLLRIIFKGLL